MKTRFENREAYLSEAVTHLRPIFERAGYPLPKKLAVCPGWPSTKALAAKDRRIGECWSASACQDVTTHMFVSPCLATPKGTNGVLDVLTHECVHAAVGTEHGHKGPFKKACKKLGLEGKPRQAYCGPTLQQEVDAIADKLGEYPHAKLDMTKSPRKKQSTRMIKCECGTCGFTVRTTKKWLDDVGAPHCPKHGEMSVELPDEDGGEAEEE
jgi:hypothetical protein